MLNNELYADRNDAMRASTVRYQWDPDLDLALNPLPRRRAIQLGLTGEIVPRYVHEWIIGLENVTELAHTLKAAQDQGQPFSSAPEKCSSIRSM